MIDTTIQSDFDALMEQFEQALAQLGEQFRNIYQSFELPSVAPVAASGHTHSPSGDDALAGSSYFGTDHIDAGETEIVRRELWFRLREIDEREGKENSQRLQSIQGATTQMMLEADGRHFDARRHRINEHYDQMLEEAKTQEEQLALMAQREVVLKGVDREEARHQAASQRTLANIEAETMAIGLDTQGQHHEASQVRLQASWADRIAVARDQTPEGEAQAQALEKQRDAQLAQLAQQQHEEQQRMAIAHQREMTSIQAETAAMELELQGKHQEASLARMQAYWDQRIAMAQSAGTAEGNAMAQTLEKQKDAQTRLFNKQQQETANSVDADLKTRMQVADLRLAGNDTKADKVLRRAKQQQEIDQLRTRGLEEQADTLAQIHEKENALADTRQPQRNVHEGMQINFAYSRFFDRGSMARGAGTMASSPTVERAQQQAARVGSTAQSPMATNPAAFSLVKLVNQDKIEGYLKTLADRAGVNAVATAA